MVRKNQINNINEDIQKIYHYINLPKPMKNVCDYVILKRQVTSHWQNGGLSAKLNFSPFYPPKAVCFCFFIKFTKRLTALATSWSELNFRSILSRTSQSRRNVSTNIKNDRTDDTY